MRYLFSSLFVLFLCTCDRARNSQIVTAEGSSEANPLDGQTARQTDDRAMVEAAKKHQFSKDKPLRMILDSDTANEIDDLFAIAYLLAKDDPRVNLLGISSAQWFHVLSGDSTVYQSQVLNEELVALSDRKDLPMPLGADMIMGKPWGGYEARDSPAARFIIEQAHATPVGEKLAVVSIGAVTNLASALALDPSIMDKVVAYMLGFKYKPDGGHWSKDEFNIRRDLNAANYLLNQEGLELHIMPTSVAIQYGWDREDTFRKLEKSGPMGPYLRQRWETNAAGQTIRTMWDVALLQGVLQPDYAPEMAIMTPGFNTPRAVWMCTDIDEEAMLNDYWQRLTVMK